MTDLADSAPIARADGLVASEVDGETVILNIDTGHFFQLNGIGSRIWDLLEAPRTLPELCAAMRDKFEVEEAECQRDVTEFVERMREHGLLAA